MRRLSSAAAVGALVIGGGAVSANQGAVVTATLGGASTSGRSLAERDALGDDEVLELGEDAGCSILLDQNAVLELCGGTQIALKKDSRRGVRIIDVASGRLRLLVEPGTAGERIEIHTPAAIATILGTIVYVAVDSETGESTFASFESQVEIRNREEASQAGTTIGARERLSVSPGGVREKKTLSQEQLEALGGCLLDFRDLALRAARSGRGDAAMERMLDVDRVAFERQSMRRDVNSGNLALDGILDVTDTDEFRRDLHEGPAAPASPACDLDFPPIPGEHCRLEDPG